MLLTSTSCCIVVDTVALIPCGGSVGVLGLGWGVTSAWDVPLVWGVVGAVVAVGSVRVFLREGLGGCHATWCVSNMRVLRGRVRIRRHAGLSVVSSVKYRQGLKLGFLKTILSTAMT